jgi:hypothetical protein
MFDLKSVRFRGPLTPYVDGFWRELLRLQYTPHSAGGQLYCAAHLSRWLDDQSLGVGDLTDERAVAFIAHRRSQGYRQYRSPRALRPLLQYLRGIGVAPLPRPPAATNPDLLTYGRAEVSAFSG